jgi:hypothetical protein
MRLGGLSDKTVVDGDGLRRGWWLGDGENTSITVFPTKRHGIVRKLLILLHLYVHKDLLKAPVGFQLVHPTVFNIRRSRGGNVWRCLLVARRSEGDGVGHLLHLQNVL